jgi:cyanobactin biosynthesis protein (PatB/AcyB/McaB family)
MNDAFELGPGPWLSGPLNPPHTLIAMPVNRYPLFGSRRLLSLIPPDAGVELAYGAPADLVRFRMYLIHGANFNDPPAWRFPSYETLKTSGRS